MKALLAVVLAVLSIFFAFAPTVSAAGHVVVSISTDAGAEHGATTTVPVIADDEGSNMCLGECTINVTFNSSVVHVTKVATGSSSKALPVVASNIQSGWVKIVSVDGSAAYNGTVTLAVLTLEAVGYSPDSGPLDLTVETLTDWYDYSQIPHTVSNGTFTILGGPEPTPTATPTSQSSGSSSSGASSTVTPTPTPVSSSTPTITQTPASATVSATPSPHVTSTPTVSATPSPHVTSTPTITQTPSPTSATPGFEAVSAIAGLLAIAYLVLRRE